MIVALAYIVAGIALILWGIGGFVAECGSGR